LNLSERVGENGTREENEISSANGEEHRRRSAIIKGDRGGKGYHWSFQEKSQVLHLLFYKTKREKNTLSGIRERRLKGEKS